MDETLKRDKVQLRTSSKPGHFPRDLWGLDTGVVTTQDECACG
jgi:hypothetical protein